MGVFVGLLAYQRFTCTPTVEHLPDGTIIRQACVAAPLTWLVVARVAAYLVGGAAVISLLSWIFLGWPAEVVSRFLGRTRPES
ncbi:MAG TPA: hypothetical protein VH684_10530 [Xanthobacteraceae bacterium]